MDPNHAANEPQASSQYFPMWSYTRVVERLKSRFNASENELIEIIRAHWLEGSLLSFNPTLKAEDGEGYPSISDISNASFPLDWIEEYIYPPFEDRRHRELARKMTLDCEDFMEITGTQSLGDDGEWILTDGGITHKKYDKDDALWQSLSLTERRVLKEEESKPVNQHPKFSR